MYLNKSIINLDIHHSVSNQRVRVHYIFIFVSALMTNTPLSSELSTAIDNFVETVGEPEVLYTPRRRRNFREWLQRLASLSYQERWFLLCEAVVNENVSSRRPARQATLNNSAPTVHTRVVRAIISRVIHPFEGESPRVVSAYARRQIAPSHNSLTLLAILEARMTEFVRSNEQPATPPPPSSVLDAPLPLLRNQSRGQSSTIGIARIEDVKTSESVAGAEAQKNELLLQAHSSSQDFKSVQLAPLNTLLHEEGNNRAGPPTQEPIQPPHRPLTRQSRLQQAQRPETSFSTRVITNVHQIIIRPPTIENLLNEPSSHQESKSSDDSKSLATSFES